MALLGFCMKRFLALRGELIFSYAPWNLHPYCYTAEFAAMVQAMTLNTYCNLDKVLTHVTLEMEDKTCRKWKK